MSYDVLYSASLDGTVRSYDIEVEEEISVKFLSIDGCVFDGVWRCTRSNYVYCRI